MTINNTTINNTTNSNTNTSALNFVGTVLGRLCPGNSYKSILTASESHMNPFQLLFVACIVVAALAMIPQLVKFETWLFDLDGDGKVDGADMMFCLRVYCCCRTRHKSTNVTVLPVQKDDIEEGGNKDKWMLLRKAYKQYTMETSKDDQIQRPINEVKFFEAAGSIVEKNVTKNLDLVSKESVVDSIYQGWLSIVYALLFLYSAVAYLAITGLSTSNGSTLDMIFCKAGQIVLLPLFKPATLSLWPAFLPLCQLAYWMLVANRANQANDEVKIGGKLKKPWKVYAGIVSPGDQPFEFNFITLAQTWLVSCLVIIYMFAGMVFLPLVIVFGVLLLPAVFLIAFIVMYLPMQLASGRCIRCVCPLLMLTRCCQPNNKNSSVEKDEDTSGTDLMALKTMGTLFFTLMTASVYFTPFYFGGEKSGWSNLVEELVSELDILSLVRLVEDLQLVLTWPEMNVAFVLPAALTVGVLVLQYTTELVHHIYDKYLKSIKITSDNFMLPMLPIKFVFMFGMYAQSGFLLLWDFSFVCWGLLTCQLQIFICCRKFGVFHLKAVQDVGDRVANKSCCLPFCKCLCGYGICSKKKDLVESENKEHFQLEVQMHANLQHNVCQKGFAASPLSRYIEHGTGGTFTLVETTTSDRDLWFASSSKKSLLSMKYLDFSGDNFGSAGLPEWIGHPNLVNVEEVCMAYSAGITSLPVSMFQLVNLRMLYLDGLRGLTEIPDAIGKLVKLKELYLKQCKGLTVLPDSIGELVNLEVFNLLECVILEKLPSTMGKLVKLEVLNLSACVSLTTLPQSMSEMVNLEWLNLAGCTGLPEFPESIKPLLPKLNIKRVCPFR